MPGFRSHRADHRFFGAMALVAAGVIVAGFANTYGRKVLTGTPQLPPVVHLHAALFCTWLVLLVAQAVLVSRGHLALHMRVGQAAVVFAGLMLVMGLATSITVARLGHRGIPGVEFPSPEGFLFLNVASIVVFAALVAAGWVYRRRAQIHKRLMLIATVAGLMPPGIARLPLLSGRPRAIARSWSHSCSWGLSTISRAAGGSTPRTQVSRWRR